MNKKSIGLSFLLSLILITLGAAHFYNQWILEIQPHHYAHVYSFKNFRKKPSDILVLGTSRSLYGVHPKAFTENSLQILGIPQLDIPTMEIVLNQHLDLFSQSKILALELGPASLFYDSERRRPMLRFYLSTLNIPFYKFPLDWSQRSHWTTRNIVPVLATFRLTPRDLLALYRSSHSFQLDSFTWIQQGFKEKHNVLSMEELRQSAQHQLKNFGNKYQLKNEKRGLESLSRMVSKLEQQNIKFCFFRPPVYVHVKYIENVLSLDGRAQLNNYLNTYGCQKNTDDQTQYQFADIEHLYKDSALIYSQKLYQALRDKL